VEKENIDTSNESPARPLLSRPTPKVCHGNKKVEKEN